MTDSSPLAVVLVSGPDLDTMRDLATRIVSERLAACVNLLPGAESIYRWEGRLEKTGEVVAIVKTLPGRAAELEKRIEELHPYDVPEIVVLNSTGGSKAYVDWVHDCLEGE